MDPRLAELLVVLERRAAEIFSSQGLRWPGLWIISGYRSARLQASINPDVPDSLHTRCPSLAADLRVGNLAASVTPDFWPFVGQIWKGLGGRWGGDFKPTPDVNHFALPSVGVGPVVLAAAVTEQPFATSIKELPVSRAPVVRIPTPVSIRPLG